MILDFAENIIQLLANMAAFLICLFQYIHRKNRTWIYAILFFIGCLISCYYWAIYMLLEGNTAETTNYLSYLGWNFAFFVLLIATFSLKSREERRFFHPLMLIPIPLNIWQLTLYLPFGGEANSIYQVTVLTAVACFSIQSICWHRRNREHTPFPYFSLATLLFLLSEFGMWTSTSFDGPISNLYYPFSFLSSGISLFIVWSLLHDFRITKNDRARKEGDSAKRLKEAERQGRINMLVPMIIIFGLMITMVIYTSQSIRKVAVTNIREVGEDKISSVASQLENYLEMTESTLWVTADTVDHMISNGASTEEILKYITEETTNQEEHFDENYTGIYGVVSGEYLDGAGWEPPEGYNPVERDWFQAAIEANGDSTIVSPYLDAQTDSIIISISRMLSNGTDVLSLDVTMNHIQDIVENLKIQEKGYGLIVNSDGMIIAHEDESRKGEYLNQTEEEQAFMESVRTVGNSTFEFEADDQNYTVFVHGIMDQWYVLIVVSTRELFAEVWQQLAVNVFACSLIFGLIVFFYFLGHRREQNYSRRIEEMIEEEQKQAYEAKVLKLEKEASDEANKAKSDFLAEMSHEIRTPINAVLGMNQMIARESEYAQESKGINSTEEIKKAFANIHNYSESIEHAGRNLLSIINDILDFSKIEAGKIEITENEYHLKSVLNDVVNMTYFKAKEKGLEFLVEVDPTLPDKLFGDEVRVNQVILNILNNAVKYTKKGRVILSVRMKNTSRILPGQIVELVISVRDTGIGIREEDQKKLFAKFARVDLKQNSTVEGTGLGLAITQSLLNMMGGNIRLESEYGSGSTFCIELPQAVVSTEPIGNFLAQFDRDPVADNIRQERFRAPDARLLIVDDTPINITVVKGLLRDTEVDIAEAGGGEEAVELAKTNRYDLILMDQRMPNMDGTQALKQIRLQSKGPNRETPVVCLTADAVIGAKERYLALGFTDYLTKPINGKDLEKMLIRYLPENKVQFIKASEPVEETEEVAITGMDDLRSIGIQPESGLKYCMNDEVLYRSLLGEFAHSEQTKRPEIQTDYETGDWKNYSILVHALKSSARMIGADGLSELALELEMASEKCDEDSIRAKHSRLTELYERTAAAIRAFCGAEENHSDSEEEILEFFPQQ